ncbi:maltose alpha-D-glucosyltransferase [Spirochaeta dissipatitropha]
MSEKINSPLWYKEAVIYEVHVKSFYDSNGDGIGDIRGLTEKLDYLQQLGVTAIWMLPFYPSPLRDDGYDIADYYAINPDYGTIEDFRELLTEAHGRGLKVITELVINHSSDQHEWFQRARKAPAGSPERDYYVWSDNTERNKDARIIFQDFEASNWTWDSVAGAYYWHRFYSHQPDLNFDNPLLQEEIFRVMEFWLDMGVDGMRLDAIPYLFERDGTNCENLPETHVFLKKLRTRIDEKYEDRMLLAEANQWPEDAVEYFGSGDECHMSFHFPLMPRIFMSMQMEDRFPIIDIMEQTPDIPENCQWALFLRNHDELTLEMVTDEERDYMYRVYARDPRARINLGIRRRLAPLLGNDRRKIELANVLLFSMPGTPVLYYGDEIGMGDNYYLGDRDGVRTPMQWSPDRNAGFSKTNPQGLYLPVIIDPEYHFEGVNVENQQRNPSSLFWWTKRLIETRKRLPAFSDGDMEFLHPENSRALAFLRKNEEQTILVVMNLSRNPQSASIDLSEYKGFVPVEVFSRNRFPVIGDALYTVTLGPWDYFWFELAESGIIAPVLEKLPEIPLASMWQKQLKGALLDAISSYIKQAAWYQDSHRIPEKTVLIDAVAVPAKDPEISMVLLEFQYTDGSSAAYSLPLGLVSEKVEGEIPAAALARLHPADPDQEDTFVVDAVYHPDVLLKMLKYFGKGQLSSLRQQRLGGGFEIREDISGFSEHDVSLVGNNLRNTTVSFGHDYIVKFYRRVEAAPNPEQEILSYLSDCSTELVPGYLGALEISPKGGSKYVLSLAQEYKQHETDGWTFAVESAGRSYEKLLSSQLDVSVIHDAMASVSARRMVVWEDIPDNMREFIEPYILGFAETAGNRTADLHACIAESDRPDFAPEAFSKLYQRSLYQSFQSQVRRVGQYIDQQNGRELPDFVRDWLNELRGCQDAAFSALRRIAGDKLPAYKIRVHNDFHLGQILWTGKDALIIDFEGRTDVPFGERRLKRPAMGDASDLMRSFHYAVYRAMQTYGGGQLDELSIAWADLWYRYTSGRFLMTYSEKMAEKGWLSDDSDLREAILVPFLLQRSYTALEHHLQTGDWVNLQVAVQGIRDVLRGAL